MRLLLLFVFTLGLAACDKKDSSGTESHGEKNRQGEIDADNRNLAERAKLAEADLRRRYRFYKGIANDYVGSFQINDNQYKMKMTFTPTLHVIDTDRVRTLEEIQYDLDNLYLNAQVVVWDVPNSIGTSGCVFEKVRPDITSGEVQLIANECPNRFVVTLTVPGTDKKDRRNVSKALADSLLEGTDTEVENLHSEVHSKFNPNGYEVVLTKD
jgi:hypothetical protein